MLTQLSPRERTNYFLVGLACLGVFGFVGARYLDKPAPIVLKPIEAAAGERGDQPKEVVVHVVGAVRKPGLLKLKPDDRVADAIERAGGATTIADLESINLAAKLVDGSQVNVPRKGAGEVAKLAEAYQGGGSEVYSARRDSSTESLRTSRGLEPGSVSLNSAGQGQFESLPQIGPATARKIIEYRKSTGGFSSVEELLKVNGIGPKKLAAIRKYVRL